MRKGTLAELAKMQFERDGAAARYHEPLVSFRLFVEARKNRVDKAAKTLAILRQVYDKGRRVRIEAHVMQWS